jgi:hypothetical protein
MPRGALMTSRGCEWLEFGPVFCYLGLPEADVVVLQAIGRQAPIIPIWLFSRAVLPSHRPRSRLEHCFRYQEASRSSFPRHNRYSASHVHITSTTPLIFSTLLVYTVRRKITKFPSMFTSLPLAFSPQPAIISLRRHGRLPGSLQSLPAVVQVRRRPVPRRSAADCRPAPQWRRQRHQ